MVHHLRGASLSKSAGVSNTAEPSAMGKKRLFVGCTAETELSELLCQLESHC